MYVNVTNIQIQHLWENTNHATQYFLNQAATVLLPGMVIMGRDGERLRHSGLPR